jgi:hypothetical protein
MLNQLATSYIKDDHSAWLWVVRGGLFLVPAIAVAILIVFFARK